MKALRIKQEVLRLEDLCLSYIIDDFSTFNYAYSSSENASVQKSLQFLQRAYSAYLLKKLCERGELYADYMKFIINRYIKELDFRIFFISFWEDLIERVIEIAESLVKITFENEMFLDYPEKTKEIITLLKNVEYLYVPYDCDDETVKLISKSCPNLKELDLRDAIYIGDEAIKSLCGDGCESVGTPSLHVLRIDCADINNETIAFILKNMPSLEIFIHSHLSYVLYSLHRNDLIENKLHTIKKYSLTELYFERDDLTDLLDFLSICTVLCPNITKLTCPVAMPDQLDLCCKFSKLEDLALCNFNQQSSINLDEFLKTRGNNLISLYIEDFSVSTSVLMQNSQRLEKLHLINVDFQDTKDASIPTLKLLKELNIEAIRLPISLEALSLILKSSPNIDNLFVLHSELTGELENVIFQFYNQNVS